MSLPSDAAGSDPGLTQPPSALLRESVTEVFTHLDDVIERAAKAQRHSRHEGDDEAFDALDDAISLLHHVRSRLRYELVPELEQDLGPAATESGSHPKGFPLS